MHRRGRKGGRPGLESVGESQGHPGYLHRPTGPHPRAALWQITYDRRYAAGYAFGRAFRYPRPASASVESLPRLFYVGCASAHRSVGRVITPHLASLRYDEREFTGALKHTPLHAKIKKPSPQNGRGFLTLTQYPH